MGLYSLDKEKIKQSIFEDSCLSLSDVPQDYASTAASAEEKIYSDWVMQLIKKQSHREVVKMRIAGLTCKQIAGFVGVSFQRIWQIYNQAVEEVKNKVTDQDLRDILKLLESNSATYTTDFISDGDVDKVAVERRASNTKIKNKIYYEKNKDKIREYFQSSVGRLSKSINHLRRKTGATIYVRDMTEEQKETLANQYVAVRTLEKTEMELLAASGKKRCSRCGDVFDFDMFYKSEGRCASECKACAAKYYEKNKDKIKERDRKYYEKNKEKIKERKMAYYEKKHLTKQNLSPTIGSR